MNGNPPRVLGGALALAGLLWLSSGPATAATDEAQPVVPEIAGDAPELVMGAWFEDFASSHFRRFETEEVLQGFQAAEATRVHDAAEFAALLPGQPVAVGDVWKIEPAAFVAFLSQIHEGVTVRPRHRHAPQSTAWGCLRAVHDRYLEIVTRVHAEVLLREEVGRKSWLTPAQFAGRLVLDRVNRRVHSFHLYVPPRDSNVDVNLNMWLPPSLRPEGEEAPLPAAPPAGPAGLIDIGFLPRMEVFGGAPLPDDVRWSHEIEEATARAELSRRIYRFLEVPYLTFEEGIEEARRTGRPLHLLILFGQLDDESC